MGNSYITGRFAHTVDFDPSSGVFNLVSNGQWDIFILKLDPAGNFVWVKQIGGVDIDEGYSITLDKSGNILTTGRFYGQVDFDPGIGTNYLTAGSILDVFISKLDSNGNFLWANRMVNGGILYSINGNAIVTDNWGSVCIQRVVFMVQLILIPDQQHIILQLQATEPQRLMILFRSLMNSVILFGLSKLVIPD
ncbi:MAG: SBBP repeat-containing protein [Bacteroidetes bacterium]|nr:SBBP repeat-containing protein [Bacteroidota bacterium]